MQGCIRTGVLTATMLIPSLSMGGLIELEEMGLFAHADGWSEAVVDMPVGDPQNNFSSQGIALSFENSLAADNTGSVTWTLQNTSGSAIDNFSLFPYLNADIDFALNTFYNEHATYVGNTSADSYEIDEPGFVFGDIYSNLMLGQLDNANAVSDSAPEDVSFALGFELGRFEIGEVLQATIDISLADIGGIMHTDADSEFSFFFNASISRSIVSVSEPGNIALLSVGLLALWGSRRKARFNNI